ncbi:hypothetical protein PILCRDRAFT_814813 [Piloderma croceum F 1598]|uniref:Uncharacterized protein n=1 Tax=Piloderma croceum (strain F 1598) TaxID=765440 RepID=A0A0C3G697_PILCF|nr:hypothetical protein PILCRDRAFT_814813 [Piloderma croceum F 1598]
MSDLEAPQEENDQRSGHDSAPSSRLVNTKVTVDERQRTMEGFRSVGLIAIFMAALQAQMLAITLSNNQTLSAKFVNAFWIAGISLDVFGAVIATITVNTSIFARKICNRNICIYRRDGLKCFIHPRSNSSTQHGLRTTDL